MKIFTHNSTTNTLSLVFDTVILTDRVTFMIVIFVATLYYIYKFTLGLLHRRSAIGAPWLLTTADFPHVNINGKANDD